MKKTLFLAVIFSLSSNAADYDAFRPQEIISVDAGAELYASSDTFKALNKDLTQLNEGQTVDNRTAIMKDGQGTFVLDEDIDMYCSLVVREGTMIIGGKKDEVTKVTDNPKLESSLFTVGGIKAELVLDNAVVSQTAGDHTALDKEGNIVSWNGGYVQAICVGGRDGDGTLTLKNNSELSHAQTLFAGTVSYATLPTRDQDRTGTSAHICGSYVSADTEDDTLFRKGSLDNGGFVGEVFKESAVSTATINVESGSKLMLGTGMSVGNTTFNIDNATLFTGSYNESSDYTKLGFVGTSDPVVGNEATYLSKTIVNITNAGRFLDNNHGYSSAWGADVGLQIDGGGNSYNEINISGASAWESKGYAKISYSNGANGTNFIRISDSSHMSIGEYALLGYAGSLVDIDVKDASYLEVKGSYLQMFQNTSIKIDKTSALRSKLLYMRSGAAVVNNGTVSGVDEEDGAVVVLNGATLENHGTLNAFTEVEGVLSGDGVFGETKLYSKGKLIVGNSPGKQTYTGNLVAYGEVNFSVDELLYPQPATDVTAGWESGCYSVIDMQGHNLELNGSITITLSATAAEQVDGVDHFELVFAQNIGNTDYYTQDVLTSLNQKTYININGQSGYLGESKLYDAHYEIKGNNFVWVYGEVTPEPTTATLSLLALAGLAARRRRK